MKIGGKCMFKKVYKFVEKTVTLYAFFEITLLLISNGELSTIDFLNKINPTFRYTLLAIIILVAIVFFKRLLKQFETKSLDFQSEKIINR